MQYLSEALGEPVVVENKPGAGGTIGSDVVANAEPDGYTFGIATSSSHAAAPVFRSDLPYDPVKSFSAVTMIGTTPYILIGGRGGRERPARLHRRHQGAARQGGLRLARRLDPRLPAHPPVRTDHRPPDDRRTVQGLGPAYPDLMNGTVAVLLDNPSGSAGWCARTADGFAVTRPSAALPDVPTFESLGVKGFDDVFWYGRGPSRPAAGDRRARPEDFCAGASSPIPAAASCAP